MTSHVSKIINIIGKLLLEELSENTFSNLSVQKKDREERYLKNKNAFPCSPFFPFQAPFGEKGEDTLLHNSEL